MMDLDVCNNRLTFKNWNLTVKIQIKFQVTSSRQVQQMELAVLKEAELWSEHGQKKKRIIAIVIYMFKLQFWEQVHQINIFRLISQLKGLNIKYLPNTSKATNDNMIMQIISLEIKPSHKSRFVTISDLITQVFNVLKIAVLHTDTLYSLKL